MLNVRHNLKFFRGFADRIVASSGAIVPRPCLRATMNVTSIIHAMSKAVLTQRALEFARNRFCRNGNSINLQLNQAIAKLVRMHLFGKNTLISPGDTYLANTNIGQLHRYNEKEIIPTKTSGRIRMTAYQVGSADAAKMNRAVPAHGNKAEKRGSVFLE